MIGNSPRATRLLISALLVGSDARNGQQHAGIQFMEDTALLDLQNHDTLMILPMIPTAFI